MLNASASSNSSRRILSKRYVFRVFLALLVSVATIVTMLVVPPVQEARGWDKLPSQAYWDAGGTGYATGSDFDVSDATNEIRFYNPDVTIENGRTKITWTVLLNTESKFFESMSTGKKMEGSISADGKAWHGRPLLMAFLPKGLDYNSIRIDRRKTGYIPSGYWGNFGCFNKEEEWKAKYPDDNFVSRVPDFIKKKGCRIQSLTGSDGVHMNQKVSDFTGYNYHHSIYDSDGGSMFNTYWEHTIGEDQRDGLGYCQPDKKGRDLCELKNWKNKFSTVVASWEYNDDALYEWKISAYVNNNVKHPELLPIIAGWHSQKTNAGESDFGATEYNKKKDTDGRRRKWSFLGPYDFDGDGIPDYIEFYKLHTDWTKPTEIKYPQYSDTSGMLSDYADKHAGKNGNTSYGGKDNVPVTTYGEPVTVKPYVNTGSWYGWDTSDWVDQSNPIITHDEKGQEIRKWSEKDHFGVKHVPGKATDTTTDLPIDLPSSDPDSTNYVNMKYELTEVPKGVKRADTDHCSVTGVNANGEGCVSIDSKTGYITYNPGKLDRTKGTINFKIKITHPNPSSYPYHCNKQPVVQENVPIKIKVVSNAMLYNPQYKETTVDYNKSTNKFNSATSEEPKSVRANKKPWVRVGSLPKGSTFKLEKYGNHGSDVLNWSKIDAQNAGNGKVTFTPSNAEAGANTKTPVVVTYPDGSTSKDKDSGNSGDPVYAPVTVGDLPISGSDLNLGLYNGKKIDNNAFGGFSFGHKSNPHEIDKGKKIGAKDKDNPNPNNGIVFDSWANHGKGPITFRVICHRTDTDNSPFALLKPAEGKEKKASGEINGLHFEDFRQWVRDNDKRCKGMDCSNSNLFLHSNEYNRDTMERSRALIGGTPKEGGSYECKVFAFHQKPGDKDSKDYSASLTAFDNASSGGSIALQSLFTNYETVKKDAKGSEWVAGSFYFKIKLKDNQKYNPTYVKMPTIQAGKSIKDSRYSSPTKDNISTDQPKSTKTGNGVPEKERASILVGDLPDGTWFEIKRFVKAGDIKNSKANSLPWANFEDGEDNVKRDEHGNTVKNNGKVVTLDQSSREYGSVTFHPDKWQSAGEYWAEVRVHYPDGSVSDGEGSVNKDHPVYAKVTVTPKQDKNKFGLNLFRYTNDSSYRTISVENGIDLHPGDLLSGNDRPKFDAYLTNAVGNLHEHMICSKQSKDGKKQIDYTYGMLPGHVNNENSKNENEKDGLRLLEPQTIWKHSSLKDQLECNANGKKCKSNTYLYDDWVDGDKSRDTFERTHGFFGGVAQKTGDYVCKVYVIKGDKESDKFKKAVEDNIAKNKKNNKNADPVDGVLKTKDNKYPYGTEGVGYKTGAFSVHIHKDNQLYNPTYTKIPEIQAGSTFDKNLKKGNKAAISSDAPQSNNKTSRNSEGKEVGANGVPKEDLVNVKEGALPAGTWYEIKRFVKASDIKNSRVGNLPWANFEDGEDNVKMKDGKKQPASDDATGKGSVTFRPDKWQDADEYWAEIRVHYPDGSVSDGEGSINKDHPIYAKVKVTRLPVNKGDLHLNVYKQYENGKFTGDVDSTNGIVVMKGVGLLKDMGIDSWSTAKPEGITLRALCRDDSDEARKKQPQVWSENLDNLFFKLNWQQAWKYPTFARQEACRKSSNNGDGCNTGDEHFLFDSTGGTMERARGTITSDKAPTKSGKYYCVVLAMKLTDLGTYKNAIKNSKISVTNNNFAKAMGFTDTEGIDYSAKFFPVTVVDKFSLPKTGGEDCVNWNMLLSVVCVIGTGAMAAGFFLDQTKWGRAMLEALLRKTLIKDFICKTAKKLCALRRRSERWRC